MSGGRGRAGGGGSNATSRASSAAAKWQNRAPSPSRAAGPRWPAVSNSPFGELWGAMNAVAAATGITKKKHEPQADREELEAMATMMSASFSFQPKATATKPQQPLPPRGGGIIRAHRPAPRAVSVRATAAGAAAAADFSSLSSFSSPTPPPLLPEEVAARLDDAPTLSALDFSVALLASALAFTLASALAPLRREGAARTVSFSFTALPLLAALAAFALALSAARERAFAARAFSARELADPDSRFAELLGVDVHYKVAAPSSGRRGGEERETGPEEGRSGSAATVSALPRFSITAMHGFGAAAFSWSLVARPLADLLDACFTKHDMPGFGLTERPSNLGLAPYSLAFNGRLARAVADLELEKLKRKGAGGEGGGGGGESGESGKTLRVLMGHSLGAVCASAEAARDPEAVDALILVAPAIVASGRKKQKREDESGTAAAAEKTNMTFSTLPMRLLSATSLFLRSIAAYLAGWAARALIVLTWPALVFLLRMAVRSFSFWENGLSAALGDGGGGGGGSPSEADEETTPTAPTTTPAGIPLWLSQRYRLPSLVRGWETGFLLFLLARVPVAAGGPLAAAARAARDAWRALLDGKGGEGEKAEASSPSPPSPPPSSRSPLTSGPPAARLAAAVRGGRVPLLVIHGDRDALVPLGNSERLVEQLNGLDGESGPPPSSSRPPCELVVLRNRGHTPQEEAPREFVEAVAAFLERVEREKEREKEQERV